MLKLNSESNSSNKIQDNIKEQKDNSDKSVLNNTEISKNYSKNNQTIQNKKNSNVSFMDEDTNSISEENKSSVIRQNLLDPLSFDDLYYTNFYY